MLAVVDFTNILCAAVTDSNCYLESKELKGK